MICTLGDVANLRSGYPFRSGLTPDSDGTIAVVQGRDVEADRLHFRPVGPLVRIMKEELRRVSEHFLQPGDVLLMARGPRNYAAVVEAEALPKLKKTEKHDIDVVIDRLKVRPDIKQRLAESFEAALRAAAAPVGLDTRAFKLAA